MIIIFKTILQFTASPLYNTSMNSEKYNIQFFSGSPRRNGNTIFLIDSLKALLAERGIKSDKTLLYNIDPGPCTDCRGCKGGKQICIIDDGMTGLYRKLEVADIIVFGTPIYWFGPTGVIKTFLDRFRPYFTNKRLDGKKAALILTAGTGEDDCDLTVQMFRRVFDALNIEYLDKLIVKAYNKNDAEMNRENLPEIENFLKTLIP